MAAAGLWTTPTDLAKFAIEMQLSLAGKSNKVLSKESADVMTKALIDNAGLGFFIETFGKTLYFGHDGADEGFRALMLVNREKGYGAVVMTNSDNGQILREVIRGVGREYGWEEFIPAPHEVIALDSAKLNQFAGRYLVNPDRVITVKNENGKLMAQPSGDPAFELLAISDTTFIRRDAPLKYTFMPYQIGGAGSGNGNSATFFHTVKIEGGGNNAEALRVGADSLVPIELLMTGKVEEAVAGYRKIKKESPNNVSISEQRLNGLGFNLIRQKKLPEAIAIFKLNTELYPESWNTYDSLGEAYMTNGDRELAIANYKKSLAMNPENTDGAAMLKKLEAEAVKTDK